MLIGVYQPNSPGSYWQITDFARLTGYKPHIVSYYSTFQQPFAKTFADQAAQNNAMVLVQWQPRGTTNAAIASGSRDSYIQQFALDVMSDDRQVIISYGQEMNGNWYPWGAGDSAADYIAAYQHIVNVFRSMGVHNVTWLWDPNVQYSGGPPLAARYPGDQYVDWVGLDGYFAHSTDTFSTLFGPSIAELRSFTSKPLLIAESGITAQDGPARVTDLFTGAELADAIGIVYFDQAQSGDIEHQDWRLEDNPPLLAAFKTAVQLYGQLQS